MRLIKKGEVFLFVGRVGLRWADPAYFGGNGSYMLIAKANKVVLKVEFFDSSRLIR